MKTFSTLQDLWEYMTYCPICQKSCRKPTVSVGPDDVFTINHYYLDKPNFIIIGKLNLKQTKSVSFKINYQDNTFEPTIKDTENTEINGSVNKADKPYFYFYLYSKCYKCDSAETNSTDIELDLFRRKLVGIGIEHETLYVLDDDGGYKIEYEYNDNIVHINEYKPNSVAKKAALTFSSSLELDFSDKDKLLNKLKTLVLFS